jgi:membrane protease YdiL (CAAX protease family)
MPAMPHAALVRGLPSHAAPVPVSPPVGWFGTAAIFGSAAVLLWLVTHGLIPAAQAATGIEPILLWFALAGLLFFAPLLAAGGLMLVMEVPASGAALWRDRLRFRPLTGGDWLWGLSGLAAVGVLSGASMAVLRSATGELSLHPPFLTMEPLAGGRWWILAAWAPFFLVNILGEEFLWHAVLLPRQEAALGRWAWVAGGLGWLAMHAAFGPAILVTLWPATFITCYVVQRRQNTWLGVLIHAGINGPGFVAVALGWV